MWQSQFFNGSKHMLLSRIETTLLSQFKQRWQSDVNNSSKCFYYRMYKTDHRFEKYFDIIDGKLLRSFVNFRFCTNVLPIEKSRWLRQ